MKTRDISAYIQDSNEIPKVRPTFSMSVNAAKLVRTRSDIGVSDKLKIAAITGSAYEKTHYHSFLTR